MSQLPENFSEVFEQMHTNTGQSLLEVTRQQLVLLVFLRPFGCTFCREALADISKIRKDIESQGVKIVFVHMADSFEKADAYFQKYHLEGCIHVCDPECKFYAAFGLSKGNLTQLLGLKTWIRGFSAGVLEMHGVGPHLGDSFQMPGVFVLNDGHILDAYIHKSAGDRPDYMDLLSCCAVK